MTTAPIKPGKIAPAAGMATAPAMAREVEVETALPAAEVADPGWGPVVEPPELEVGTVGELQPVSATLENADWASDGHTAGMHDLIFDPISLFPR